MNKKFKSISAEMISIEIEDDFYDLMMEYITYVPHMEAIDMLLIGVDICQN